MKYKLLLLIFMMILTQPVYANDLEWTDTELVWIEEHIEDTITLGLDPFSGMDFFTYRGKQYGYIIDVVDILRRTTGLDIQIIGDSTWGEVYAGLQEGSIDILFGANETEERLKFMRFTEPIAKYPYAIFSYDGSKVYTIGDLDKKRVGFIEGDIAIEFFKNEYSKIEFDVIEFPGQPEGLDALSHEEIDGFITSGGGIVYDFLYHYPNITFVGEINDITSDMTLSARIEDEELVSIMSKVISAYMDSNITKAIQDAQITYNRKLLNLTDEEYEWLESKGTAVVGVAEDYLPIDYYHDDKYLGVAGEILKEIENMIGIEFFYQYNEFDKLYQQALNGDVEILNIAKTDERLNHFIFPRAFSEERDAIYGKKDSPHVQDIYGLENKRVAVIKGFWHEEYLDKNLRNIQIIETNSIKESIRIVNSGLADYFIENPTVAEFYISGLGYWNIVNKGETSRDSFLYFGVSKQEPVLASLIDKSLRLIDYEKAKQRGIDTVPSLISRQAITLIWIIAALIIVVGVIAYILMRSIKILIREREETASLREREHMMYLDPLTGLNNRLYYNFIEFDLDLEPYPQSVIISDLNHLKTINDSMGHHIGDSYIEAFGTILKETVKDGIVCRMGGDEFMIIKTDCTAEQTEKLIETLQKKMKKFHMKVNEHEIKKIEAAFGYAIRYDRYQPLNNVLVEADDKMYAHKFKMKK